MGHAENIGAPEALARLRAGNETYVNAGAWIGDVSAVRREELADGQAPFALIVCCSDSRVVPEALFGCGLGELFVVRVAGNVIGGHALGSIEYATEHLGVKLVVVLGHTHCGAVAAARAGEEGGLVGMITRDIAEAIGGETDPRAASIANARRAAEHIRECFALDTREDAFQVVPALFDIETGVVEWPEA